MTLKKTDFKNACNKYFLLKSEYLRESDTIWPVFSLLPANAFSLGKLNILLSGVQFV